MMIMKHIVRNDTRKKMTSEIDMPSHELAWEIFDAVLVSDRPKIMMGLDKLQGRTQYLNEVAKEDKNEN